MSTREIAHIALSTSSDTKKLHVDNKPEFITWLEANNKFFDVWPANLTIYCQTKKERKKIEKQLKKLTS